MRTLLVSKTWQDSLVLVMASPAVWLRSIVKLRVLLLCAPDGRHEV